MRAAMLGPNNLLPGVLWEGHDITKMCVSVRTLNDEYIGAIHYVNTVTGTIIRIIDLNHSGSGRYSLKDADYRNFVDKGNIRYEFIQAKDKFKVYLFHPDKSTIHISDGDNDWLVSLITDYQESLADDCVFKT